MSIAKRLISGNIATLSSMMFQIGAQVLVVPVFLQFWGPEQYGLWLAIIAAKGLITIIALSYHDYLGFECLKLFSNDRMGRSLILSDAMPVVAFLGVAMTACSVVFLESSAVNWLLNVSEQSDAAVSNFKIAMIVQIILWTITTNLIGILDRILVSMGYFARCTWWSLASIAVFAIVPAIAAALGASLVGATMAYVSVALVLSVANYIAFARLLRREGIQMVRPDLGAGFGRLARSLGVAFSAAVEFMQQTGFRLLLLPFLGAVQLAAFATHRTVANVAQQGINTLVNPSQPEMLQLIAQRDGVRFLAVVATMNFIVTGVVCPAFVVVQLVIDAMFSAWTVGRIEYDALTFALLSASVLMLGLCQPSRSIIRGNNLVATQIGISCGAAAVLGGFAWVAIPAYGIRGAAGALLAAEVTRAFLSIAIARRWTIQAALPDYIRPLLCGVVIVVATATAVIAIAMIPRLMPLWVAAYFVTWSLLHIIMWRSMPGPVRGLLSSNLSRLRGRGGRLIKQRPFSAPE